jgi:hypothetical protein
MHTDRWTALALAIVLGTACAGAAAQTRMFKCGSNYQDRPCAEQDVQQRYTHAAGRFDVEQVNPDTDRDCARAAADAMPYWLRLRKGESLDALRAEFDVRPVAREQKSEMRDLLVAMQGVQGTPTQARSQFEAQCMAAKRRKGHVTEQELADARAAGRAGQPGMAAPSGTSVAAQRALIEQRRADVAAARAAAAAARSAR